MRLATALGDAMVFVFSVVVVVGLVAAWLLLSLRKRILVGVVVFASAWGWFIWPTPYRTCYFQSPEAKWGMWQETVLREHRLTGEREYLTMGHEWAPYHGDKRPAR